MKRYLATTVLTVALAGIAAAPAGAVATGSSGPDLGAVFSGSTQVCSDPGKPCIQRGWFLQLLDTLSAGR